MAPSRGRAPHKANPHKRRPHVFINPKWVYALFFIVGALEVVHFGWSAWFNEEAKAVAEGFATVAIAAGHLFELAE